MKNVRQGGFGLLEKTLLEFKQKGNNSVEEIKEYLFKRYHLTVSYNALKKRIKAGGF
jgi:hypothetical protein